MEGHEREARSRKDEAARFLAEQWGLEYREPHTLSIDPSALRVIDAGEARRLGAFPLELDGTRPVFAIAEPSNDRLDAIRAASSPEATFVLVAPAALDALLSSKMFNSAAQRDAPTETAPPPTPVDEPETRGAEAEPPPAPQPRAEPAAAPPPAAPPPTPSRPPELQPTPQPERRPSRPVLVAVGPEPAGGLPSERLGNLLSQITAGAANLASQADELQAALEDSQRELRNARAQLEEARLESDSASTELAALRAELAQSHAVNEAVTARLRDLVSALESAQGSAAWTHETPDVAALEATTRIA